MYNSTATVRNPIPGLFLPSEKDIMNPREKEMGIKVALVDNEPESNAKLKEFIAKYGMEKSIDFSVSVFEHSLEFIDRYKPKTFDVLFLDIDMPYLNGIQLAEKIREADSEVMIIFVTNLAQYAINGYDVNAFAFIVKPISYTYMKVKLDKIVPVLNINQENQGTILIKGHGKAVAVNISDIRYIEVVNHKLIFHMTDEEITTYSTMKAIQGELKDKDFVSCSQSHFINLKYVTSVKNNSVFLSNDEIFVSRGMKKDFLEAFSKYIERRM